MSNTIGTNPDQIPLNGMLGTLAFQDADGAAITEASVIDGTSTSGQTVSASVLKKLAVVSYASVASIPTGFVGTCRVGTDLYVGDGTSIVKSGTGSLTYPSSKPSLNLDFVNSKQVDSRVTFSRNSTATYYDGHTVAMAEQNLLLYSQDFTNAAWSKSNITATGNNITAPDGTTTASLITNSVAGNCILQQSLTLATAIFTQSAFLKIGTERYVGVRNNGSVNNYAIIDLQTGIATQIGSGATVSIVVSTNGFYRVSVTMTASSISNLVWYFTDNNATAGYNPSVVSTGLTFYMWGAQLEARSSVTAYTPTNTQNILPYSQDFTNAAWTKTNSTVGTLTYTDPLGTTTAQKIVETSSTGLHGLNFATNLMPAGSSYTYSVYLKQGERSVASVYIFDGANYNQAWFNLGTGAIITTDSSVTGTITSVGNSWYRCSITSTVAKGAIAYGGVLALNTSTYTAPTELITNGDFSSATGWTADTGWTIANGNSTAVAAANGTGTYRNIVSTVGKIYKITFTISNYISGSVYPTLYNSNNGATVSGNGTYTSIITKSFPNSSIAGVVVSTAFTGSIDDISVVEIPGQYFGDGTSGLYAWGSQLEAAAVTTTGATASGLNLIPYSNAFDNAVWTKSNSSIQYNLLTYSQNFSLWSQTAMSIDSTPITAPDGTNTGSVFICPASGLGGRVTNTKTATSTSVTFSAYAKAPPSGVFNGGRLLIYNSTTATTIGSNSFTSSFVTTGPAAIPVGNGWYRIILTVSSGITIGDTIIVYLYTDNAGGVSISNIAYWGAQLVQGTSAGDYTATTSASLPVKYIAPDNTFAGEMVQEDTTAAVSHQIQNVISSITLSASNSYTYSVYAKPAGRTQFRMMLDHSAFTLSSGQPSAVFNLSTGVVGTLVNTLAANTSITPAGNGWYKCSMTVPVTTGATATLTVTNHLIDSTPAVVYTGDGASGILIWNEQFGTALAPTYYTTKLSATSTAITNYIPQLMTAPINTPRLDYNPTTGKPLGLLIEESRTNLLTYSQDFSQSVWGKSTGLNFITTYIAPDGTLTANKTIPNTTSGLHYSANQTLSAPSSTTATFSMYAKAGEYSKIAFEVLGYQNVYVGAAGFDLITGNTVYNPRSSGSANVNKGMVPVGNGWWRCFITFTFDSSVSALSIPRVQFLVDTLGTYNNFTGDGYSGIYIWGAQLEAGSFATSYIPTIGTTVVRQADVASVTGANFSGWYNQNQGTVYGEFDLLNASSASMVPYAIDNGSSNGYMFYKNLNASSLYAYAGTNNTILLNGTVLSNTNYKSVVSYGTSIYATVNGASPVSVAIGGLSGATPNKLSIGYSLSSSNQMSGHIKKISYYPVALTSAELQGLTS